MVNKSRRKSPKARNPLGSQNPGKGPNGTSLLADPTKLPAPLQQLHLYLSSPKQCAPGTLHNYIETGCRFIEMIGKTAKPTADDARRYFVKRRGQEISERTLRKEFYQLKALFLANRWEWEFTKRDVPASEETPYRPTVNAQDVIKLIQAWPKYTKAERFYLACETQWGFRREEMARINKRDYDGQVLLVRTAKHGVRKKHLIPEILKPLFTDFRPTISDADALSALYRRICEKAGHERQHREGFHSLRRIVFTMLKRALVKNDEDESWAADYLRWSEAEKGREFSGAAMAGVYEHSEAITTDPLYQEKRIIEIHPFLPYWKGVNTKEPVQNNAG